MRRTRKSDGRGFKLILFFVAVILAVSIGRQEYEIYKIRQEQEATQTRINALKQEKAELEAERRRLDDPKYIEKLAREDYNMVGKNEVPLFIVDKNKKAEQN